MSKLFAKAADKIEAALGHPIAFFAAFAYCVFVPLASIDVANYGISVATLLLLFLTIGSNRRDRKAVHVKLDDLECAVETANSDNARIEELQEHEIDARR